MYVYICLCVCVWVCVYIFMCMYVSICMNTCMYRYITPTQCRHFNLNIRCHQMYLQFF